MTDKKDDGGAAFPEHIIKVDGGTYAGNPGMSLRDYFAIHATDPDVYVEIRVDESADNPSDRCAARYRFADKMLKERSK